MSLKILHYPSNRLLTELEEAQEGSGNLNREIAEELELPVLLYTHLFEIAQLLIPPRCRVILSDYNPFEGDPYMLTIRRNFLGYQYSIDLVELHSRKSIALSMCWCCLTAWQKVGEDILPKKYEP